MQQALSIPELDKIIATCERRLQDPELKPAEKEVFQVALQNAQISRSQLAAPVTQPPFRQATGAASQQAQTHQSQSSQTVHTPSADSPVHQKKTKPASRIAVHSVDISCPTTSSSPAEIFVETNEYSVGKPTLVFNWKRGGQERLKPGQVKQRVMDRVGKCAALKADKKLEESASFNRAIEYYHALCEYHEKELEARFFPRIIGAERKAVFQKVQAARRVQVPA